MTTLIVMEIVHEEVTDSSMLGFTIREPKRRAIAVATLLVIFTDLASIPMMDAVELSMASSCAGVKILELDVMVVVVLNETVK